MVTLNKALINVGRERVFLPERAVCASRMLSPTIETRETDLP